MARRRRFTRWREDRRVIDPKLLHRDDKGNYIGPAVEQLAAYEDSELTPAQVVAMRQERENLLTEISVMKRQAEVFEAELMLTRCEREYFRSQSRFFREMSGNLPKVIAVEGYRAFRGTVMVKPRGRRSGQLCIRGLAVQARHQMLVLQGQLVPGGLLPDSGGRMNKPKQEVFCRGLSQAICDHMQHTGKEPELILVRSDVFCEISGGHKMINSPHWVMEYDGIRLIVSPHLKEKIILVEKMQEVPTGYFPEIVNYEK